MIVLFGATLSILLIGLVLKILNSSTPQNDTVNQPQPQQFLSQPTGEYAIQLHEALEAVLATMQLGKFYVDGVPLDVGVCISRGVETYTFALLYLGEKIVPRRLAVFRRAFNQAVARYCRLTLGRLSLAFPAYTAFDWQQYYPLLYSGFSAISVYDRDGYIYIEIVVLDTPAAIQLAQKRK